MTLVRTVPPAALPLSLTELKLHLRVDGAEEDALIMAYLRAAVEYVEHDTGLGLITQTWEQSFSAFGSRMVLWRRPLQSVDSIVYLDSADVELTLAASAYRVVGIGHSRVPGGWLGLAHGSSWPTPYTGGEPIVVTYTVGFGDTHNDVPESIRHALMLLVGTWYDYRADLTGSAMAEMPMASRALLHEWRPVAIA